MDAQPEQTAGERQLGPPASKADGAAGTGRQGWLGAARERWIKSYGMAVLLKRVAKGFVALKTAVIGPCVIDGHAYAVTVIVGFIGLVVPRVSLLPFYVASAVRSRVG